MYAGWAELLAGDAPAAERELRIGYEALERMGEQSYLSTTAAYLARAVFAQARYEEAEGLTEVSDEAAAEDDLSSHAMWRGTRARVLARRNDGDAERLARESVYLSLETDSLNVQADASRRPRGDAATARSTRRGRGRPLRKRSVNTRQREPGLRAGGRRGPDPSRAG